MCSSAMKPYIPPRENRSLDDSDRQARTGAEVDFCRVLKVAIEILTFGVRGTLPRLHVRVRLRPGYGTHNLVAVANPQSERAHSGTEVATSVAGQAAGARVRHGQRRDHPTGRRGGGAR